MNTMTDEEVDGRLRQIPVIKEIKEEVQDTNNRLDKGAKRMDSIEDEMRKGFRDILEIVEKGNEDRVKKHQQVMDKLDEEKEKRFISKLKEVTDENSKLKDKLWSYAERAFWLIIVLVAGIYGFDVPL